MRIPISRLSSTNVSIALIGSSAVVKISKLVGVIAIRFSASVTWLSTNNSVNTVLVDIAAVFLVMEADAL